jgi:hypothetical protein
MSGVIWMRDVVSSVKSPVFVVMKYSCVAEVCVVAGWMSSTQRFGGWSEMMSIKRELSGISLFSPSRRTVIMLISVIGFLAFMYFYCSYE